MLARRNVRTLLLDHSALGHDVEPAHALMRGGVLQLSRWGVLDGIVAAGTPPVRRTTFRHGREQHTTSIKPSPGVDALYAPRRAVLDALLVRAAVLSGVEVRHGTTATDVIVDRDRVVGLRARTADRRFVELRSSLVIGADGSRSTIAERVGAPFTRVAEHTSAMAYGFWPGLRADEYDWNFRPNASSGIIPTNDDVACVFVSASPKRIGRGGVGLIAEIVGEAEPQLAAHLRSTSPSEGPRTWTGSHGFIRRSQGPGWALVGDAGCSTDPIGAHGLTAAFRDAELLARAVVGVIDDESSLDDALRRYEVARDEIGVVLFDVVERIASQRVERRGDRATAAAAELGDGRRGRGVGGVRGGDGSMSKQTLLGIWAHPDDEAYLSAGLMAEFRQRGDRVAVVTATLGDHGTSDPTTFPPHRLAALRHIELRNSLAAVDVDELYLLGFEDGTCPEQDGTAAIGAHIAEIAPDVIVTFGPDGLTGHPDHRAVSRWATDAWANVRPQASLWYATLTADFHRQWGPTNESIGLWADQPDPPCTETADDRLQHHVARRGARHEDGRAPGSRVTDETIDGAGRPRDLPRVVAHRVVPPAIAGALAILRRPPPRLDGGEDLGIVERSSETLGHSLPGDGNRDDIGNLAGLPQRREEPAVPHRDRRWIRSPLPPRSTSRR